MIATMCPQSLSSMLAKAFSEKRYSRESELG